MRKTEKKAEKRELIINGNKVFAEQKLTVSEAALIVGKSAETLRIAIRRTDDRRLQAGTLLSNGRLFVRGIDLFLWTERAIEVKQQKSFVGVFYPNVQKLPDRILG